MQSAVDNTTVPGGVKPATTLVDDSPLPNQWESCWNVELDDETLFCYGSVHWPITYELYKNADVYDASKASIVTNPLEAKADYKNLLIKWRET